MPRVSGFVAAYCSSICTVRCLADHLMGIEQRNIRHTLRMPQCRSGSARFYPLIKKSSQVNLYDFISILTVSHNDAQAFSRFQFDTSFNSVIGETRYDQCCGSAVQMRRKSTWFRLHFKGKKVFIAGQYMAGKMKKCWCLQWRNCWNTIQRSW